MKEIFKGVWQFAKEETWEFVLALFIFAFLLGMMYWVFLFDGIMKGIY